MNHRLSIALQPCGSCVSHSHCKDCCANALEDLLKTGYLQKATLDPEEKILSVESPLESDALEDLLDEKGVYVLGFLDH